MTELVGDNCQPSELRIPTLSGAATDTHPTYEGAMFLSGATAQIVTSDGLKSFDLS